MCGRPLLSKLQSEKLWFFACSVKTGYCDQQCLRSAGVPKPMQSEVMSVRRRAAPKPKVQGRMCEKSTRDSRIKASGSCLVLLLFFLTPESFVLLIFYQNQSTVYGWSESENFRKTMNGVGTSGGQHLASYLTNAPRACRYFSR